MNIICKTDQTRNRAKTLAGRHLAEVLGRHLLARIHERLEELDSLIDRHHCACCGYQYPDVICPPCLAGDWPPFSEYFRTRGQAYACWGITQAVQGLYQVDGAHRHILELLADQSSSWEAIGQGLARLQGLTQRELRPFPRQRSKHKPRPGDLALYEVVSL